MNKQENDLKKQIDQSESKLNQVKSEIVSLPEEKENSHVVNLSSMEREATSLENDISQFQSSLKSIDNPEEESKSTLERSLSGDVGGREGMIFHVSLDSRQKASIGNKISNGSNKDIKGPSEIPAIQNAAKAAIKDMLDSTGGTNYKVDDPKFKQDIKEYYKGAMETLGNGKPLMQSDFLQYLEERGHNIPQKPAAGKDAQFDIMKTELNEFTHLTGAKQEMEFGESTGKSIFFANDIFKAGVAEAQGSLFVGDFEKVSKDFSLFHKIKPEDMTFEPAQDNGQGLGIPSNTQKL